MQFILMKDKIVAGIHENFLCGVCVMVGFWADYDCGVVWWGLSDGLWFAAGIGEKMF